MKPVTIDFIGEQYRVEHPNDFTVGRDADLTIDDNPYLHRHFLRIYEDFGLWWLGNVGSLLSATVSDGTGQVQAWLAPGAKLPIVFQTMHIMFSAGSTTYDFTIHTDEDYFNTSTAAASQGTSTTIAPVTLTTSQRQLILSLAEGLLRQTVPGRGDIPTSANAAQRLGWSMTTFNRKLDNVCDKLDKIGVQGLRGGAGKLATNRRARLVEYAIASHLVSVEDLYLLDLPKDSVKGADGD
ncbi:hypothetical protein GCM10027515_33090 [Schumannella luteola]|uniref:Uncharacterized protein n=1 Tax=Schumannella luteola TaxID=472059 RepID=A0A852YCI5_9MICO|nr:hypothetical protein [Schumannella luteola]NYG98891.1 hypothetical protein [Schumannella luteola]TPX06272.1 hypothetical protein FJ656_01100 [Schumannella luteola]